MKITKRGYLKSLSRESGQVFPLVLVLLLIGSLIIVPLLVFMGTGAKTTQVYATKADELYAADAGIEDARMQIEYDRLHTIFTSPGYEEYDFGTNWAYNLGEPLNSLTPAVTIQNRWIPKDVDPPTPEAARTIITTGKLIVSGNKTSPTNYQIKIAYYPGDGETLLVDRIGVWLGPGMTYVTGSSNLEADHLKPYYKVPLVQDYAGGQSVVWNYSSLHFENLPGVIAANTPRTTQITFQYALDQAGRDVTALSWIKTGGVADIPLAWDADTQVYKLTSTAGATQVEAYVVQNELRELDKAIGGDYCAIGNTLQTATGDEKYRNRLLRDSSAIVNINKIPDGAAIKAAWLYWSGWIEGGNEIISFTDACTNLNYWTAGRDWAVSSGKFRAHHSYYNEADRYLTLASSINFSAYAGKLATMTWDQSTGGSLEAADMLQFGFSGDGGATWSPLITAFADDNPISKYSYNIPDIYLTANFKVRLYGASLAESGEYVYLDNIKIIYHDIQVNQVMLNGQLVTAQEQQLKENNDRTETVGTWSYSCFYNATDLVRQWIHSGALATSGWGTYTVGHVMQARPGSPAYSYSVYPSGTTGYPLGIPALTQSTRYEYAYAIWSLILVYSSPQTKGHQLYLYDDFTFIGQNDTLDLPVGGFLTPPDTAGSRLTVFVGEGDNGYTGDYVEVNSHKLSDAMNPSNNVFNSRSNALDNPSVNGIDLDTFNVSAYVNAGDTSATIRFGSQIEIYNVVYMIVSFRSNTLSKGTVTYLIKSGP
jgi:hypothetical protein